ncbi:MAG: hypothetical protein ACLGJB_10790 [Blastocatellia bacterium]
MPAQKTRNNQAGQVELRPLIPQDVRDNLIGKCGLNELDTLAGRLDALSTAAHAGDIEAVRKIAKESKRRAYRQLTEAIISAIERGETYIAYREVDDLLYAAFRFSRAGCYAVVSYREMVRAQRSQAEGGANES